MNTITVKALYDLTHTIAADYLAALTYPWEALAHIGDWILELGERLDPEVYEEVEPNIWIAKTATVAKTALIEAPAIIGPDTKIMHCAYVRGRALIGAGVTVGNSTEVKNAILFDGVQVPHYNYVGDSVLGHRAHLGGGALLSNYRSDGGLITVRGEGFDLPTGRNKVGAMIGDFGEIGAGAVLNPGTVVGARAIVYPLVSVRGVVPAESIYKERGNIVPRRL